MPGHPRDGLVRAFPAVADSRPNDRVWRVVNGPATRYLPVLTTRGAGNPLDGRAPSVAFEDDLRKHRLGPGLRRVSARAPLSHQPRRRGHASSFPITTAMVGKKTSRHYELLDASSRSRVRIALRTVAG